MKLESFNQKDIIFALDIGTRSIIGTVGIIKDKKFHVVCEKYLEHEERAMVDGQIHDINLVASVVQKVKACLEEELQIHLNEVSIAAAGRFLRTVNVRADIELNEDEEVDKEIVRSLELSAVKKAEEEIAAITEGKLYCVGYSVKGFYLNGYLISNLVGHKGQNIGAEVIATFLPRSVIDSLYSVMNKVNLKVVNLTLEPIAAMEAAIPKNLRLLNIALVDIGAGTSDIAISSKESISAYGMVPMAGDEVTEAIVQEYLVDFNTAENIKRTISKEKEVIYTDILGLENTIPSENVFKLVDIIVNKIAQEISKKILELNGDKAPSAVFLVGGGAHTPGILEAIAHKLNLQPQRIAIKDRKVVTECISDNILGSAGVTVLGIALTAIRSLGNDFIDVILNNDPISLFNSHNHIIMDVLLQAGINPSLLISKNGKSVRFNYNGCKRIVFGEYGINAKITINGQEATLETEIKENDNIILEYAQNGKDAAPKLCEHIRNINSISLYLDEEIINIDPVILVSGKRENLDYAINNGDEIKVFLPCKVCDLKEYILKEDVRLLKDGIELEDTYEISEGDHIIKEIKDPKKIEVVDDNLVLEEKIEIITKNNNDKNIEINSMNNCEKIEMIAQNEAVVTKEEFHSITVKINGENTILKGKAKYVIVDIFDYINFDLTIPKGIINLNLNGEKSSYTAQIKDSDIIEVFGVKFIFLIMPKLNYGGNKKVIDLKKEANIIKDELIKIRRDLHEHPELGFEEVRTSKVIKDFLKANQIPYIEVAKTGVCGIIKGTKEGNNKTIALRGDIDALPIKDMKTCEFKSKIEGKMHACGHDAHTTILMGVGKLLNKHKDKFSGTVKLLFEPAEETTGGAQVMISERVLENPKVDCILGLHVDEETKCGAIKIKKGVVNAASNPFSIKITGQGGHGASPHTTVDPIVIASHIVIAIQTIVSREIAPVNPIVITFGTLHAGTAQNIIPGEATLSGMIRTMTKEDRTFAIKRLNEIVDGVATMSRAKAEIKVEESYPCLYNNDEFVDLITESANEVLGIRNVLEQKAPKMGVESFAYFANERPSAFYFLGSGSKDKKTTEPAHSNLFNIDEDCLTIGVSIQALAAFNYLTK